MCLPTASSPLVSASPGASATPVSPAGLVVPVVPAVPAVPAGGVAPHAKARLATRRRLIAGGPAALVAGTAAIAALATLAKPTPLRAAPLARLALYGPPASPSITLAHAVATGALEPLAGAISLVIWRSPDELRAGLTSGSIDLSIVPIQSAANLYNRGLGLRLVNVMTDGLLHLVGPQGSARRLEDFAGKRVAVPMVNDTPDFIFRALLDRKGLAGRIDPVTPGSAIEAAQMLLAGRIDAALLSEPAATAAVLRSASGERPLARLIDVQQAWAEVSGRAATLPQAGLAVTRAFEGSHSEVIGLLQQVLGQVTARVNADPAAAAASASGPLEQPAPLLAAAIPFSRLVARPASSARADIESMLELMARRDPAIIGGKLPDDGFYAL